MFRFAFKDLGVTVYLYRQQKYFFIYSIKLTEAICPDSNQNSHKKITIRCDGGCRGANARETEFKINIR